MEIKAGARHLGQGLSGRLDVCRQNIDETHALAERCQFHTVTAAAAADVGAGLRPCDGLQSLEGGEPGPNVLGPGRLTENKSNVVERLLWSDERHCPRQIGSSPVRNIPIIDSPIARADLNQAIADKIG